MFDFANLGKDNANNRVNKAAKEMFLDLIAKQLTFQESMGVIQTLHQTLAAWGQKWLDDRYLTHLKEDLEKNGHKL
jgi:methanogenic corrinoid protein MtbC1